jgi:hypothetical protein
LLSGEEQQRCADLLCVGVSLLAMLLLLLLLLLLYSDLGGYGFTFQGW